ncbi:MAG: HD domain-containing protein [Rhodospirillales bacterium]|nr:HD domain-containing protein [Rhodospirillales bacterium]
MIETLSNTVSVQNQLQEIHASLKLERPEIGRIAVAIYDEQTDILKTFVHSTDGEAPFSHYEARLNQVPSLRDLALSHDVRVIDDLQIDGVSGSLHILRLVQTGYRSSYTIPFYDHGRFFGFMFFDSSVVGYFSEAVVRHLELHAHLISLLIINEVSRVTALRSAIDVARAMSHSRNEETGAHLDRMARYARLIAKALADRDPGDAIDDEFVEYVFLYAPLHDVGKIAIPDQILLKPKKLSDDEFTIMKSHVSAGMGIVESIATGFNVGSGQHVEVLRNIVRYHHEAYDGSGYLEGRAGAGIPLEARIVTVADVFDALTTERCYKPAWTNDRAFDFLRDQAGRRFDPDCVDAMLGNRRRAEHIQTQFRSNNRFHEAYTEEL